MSDKDLQRVAECASDIGQASPRRSLPPRRNHITQKVRVAGRTLYISVHDDPSPAELFLRVKGTDYTPETIALYDVIARLMNVALQYGASLEMLGDLLTGAKIGSGGPVAGHDRPWMARSLARDTPTATPTVLPESSPHAFISRERRMAELAHMALIDAVEMFDLPDLIGWHLLVECCGRGDMAHVLVGGEERVS